MKETKKGLLETGRSIRYFTSGSQFTGFKTNKKQEKKKAKESNGGNEEEKQ